MTSSPWRAIVAGHGDFAAGVVSAVVQISGRDDVFTPMSNRGLGADEIEQQMRERIAEVDARVIFTDLAAGSCTLAARRVLRDRDDLVLVTGANVATLLDFVFHEDASLPEAAKQAVDRGRASINVTGAPRGS